MQTSFVISASTLCLIATMGVAFGSEGSGRVLGSHRFIESEAVRGPFITTKVSAMTGAGIASAEIPTGDVDEDGVGDNFDLSAAVLAQMFEFSYAPTEWLSLRVEATGGVLSGANTDSALVLGAEAVYGYVVGAQASVLRKGGLQVSVSADADVDSSVSFSILKAIEASLAAGKVNRKTLISKSRTTTIKPGAQVAYGLNPTVGFWAALSYAHVVSSSADDTDATVDAGVGVSVDFAPSYDVPVGFAASVAFESEGEAATRKIGSGVFYTGRPALQTGVEIEQQTSELSPGTTLEALVGLVKLRYYW